MSQFHTQCTIILLHLLFIFVLMVSEWLYARVEIYIQSEGLCNGRLNYQYIEMGYQMEVPSTS